MCKDMDKKSLQFLWQIIVNQELLRERESVCVFSTHYYPKDSC